MAKFRQHGRFPVLSYYHKATQMVLLRSSQPLTGPSGNRRCKEDERFLNAALPRNSRRGYVVDTRHPQGVKAAQAKGGGIEPEAHYPQWKKIHCGLERPGMMMDAYSKMVEACNDSSGSSWLARVNDSGWLGHVKDLLHASCLVAQCVAQEDACVLVHGTEGLDTTLQVTSLAQILLSPDTRTIRGFQALVHREWLSFGHPFRERHSRGPFAASNSAAPGGEAPSFLLFLDCVHQVNSEIRGTMFKISITN
jgi:myotubularin-related protein 9